MVPKPKDKNVIGTRPVSRNNMNEQGEVARNKEILLVMNANGIPLGSILSSWNIVSMIDMLHSWLCLSMIST